MNNVKDLLDKGLTNRAATALYDALFYLINKNVPGANLTKEEFDSLLPTVVNKIKDPDSVIAEDEYEGPYVVPSTARLVITFSGPEGVTVPEKIEQKYAVGKTYEYEVPQIEGCVSDVTTVSGKMMACGMEVHVTYTLLPEEPVEPIYATFSINNDDYQQECGQVITGNGTPKVEARITSGKFKFTVKDEKIGRNYDAYWPSFDCVPDKTKINTEEDAKRVKCRLLNNNQGKWNDLNYWEEHEFSCKKDDGDLAPSVSDQHFGLPVHGVRMRYWCPVSPDRFTTPNGADGSVHWLFQFDWNGDGIYEQEFDFVIDPTVVLVLVSQDNKEIEQTWPKK